MANYANNIIKVDFLGSEYETNQDLFKVGLDSEVLDLSITWEGEGILEIEFSSKWSEPTELLIEMSIKYQCDIVGVSYEFGNNYVNSFEFYYKELV